MEVSAGINRELPLDLLWQILMRLPVKSLCRFRCVSKLWLSVIADSRFAEAYALRTGAHPHIQLSVVSAAAAAPGTGTAAAASSSWIIRKLIQLLIATVAIIGIAAAVSFAILFLVPNHPPGYESYPTFQVRDFAVSNFSLSDHGPELAAIWEANLTVFNPDWLGFELRNMHSFVYYRNTASGRLSLGTVEPQPLYMDINTTASITARTHTTIFDKQKASDVKDIREELQGTGAVSFGLGIHLKEARSGLEDDADVVTIYCDRLEVAFRFSGDIGFGTLSSPSNSQNTEVPCRPSYCERFKRLVTRSRYC